MHLREHQHTPLNVHVHVKPSAKSIDLELLRTQSMFS